MTDCRWTAQDIVDRINSGDKGTAKGMCQSLMNTLSADDFKQLAEKMRAITTGTDDKDEWNDVEIGYDGQGNVKWLTINDTVGPFDTVLATKNSHVNVHFTQKLQEKGCGLK